MNTFLRVFSSGALAATMLAACIFTPSKYADDMRSCLDNSATCSAYVACREDVAKRNGTKFDGQCTLKDASHE